MKAKFLVTRVAPQGASNKISLTLAAAEGNEFTAPPFQIEVFGENELFETGSVYTLEIKKLKKDNQPS